MPLKVVSVVGNRPQFIKAAPVQAALEGVCDHVLVHTGQHYDRELSQVFFDELGLRPPDHTITTGSGSHEHQTAAMLEGLAPLLAAEQPDLVLSYGDTNSTLAASLVAAKARYRLGHVESGLRSFDRDMPEEINRVVADVVSDLRFCPSETAVRNLAAEGITAGVHLVGDVMIDAALTFAPVAQRRSTVFSDLGVEPGSALVTVHRQSNTTPDAMPALVEVLEAIDRPAVFPLHPRTRVALDAAGLLDRAAAAATLAPPLGYLDFTALLSSASVCLTDSGGV
jgi:UDP-GlcNAc3NAcA epimerase